MKIQFHVRGLNISADWRRWMECSVNQLQSVISIADAAVVIEHQRDLAPAFRAYVSLAVPGPDIHSEARGHTLEAVWLKVTTALSKQVEERRFRQRARVKTNGHVRARVMRR